MRYMNADTGDEISKLLRGDPTNPKVIAARVADRLLGIKPKSEQVIITAPRQSGKTTELLRFAEEKYPNGQFAIVCINRNSLLSICHIYRHLRRDPSVSPPLMLLPDNLKLVGNESKPLFCDEIGLFTTELKESIIGYRKFVAAVTS